MHTAASHQKVKKKGANDKLQKRTIATQGSSMRRSRGHPCWIKISLATASSHAHASVKRPRYSTRCKMDHERRIPVHRYRTCKQVKFLSKKISSFLHSQSDHNTAS